MFKNIKLALKKSRKRFHSLINVFEKNNFSESDILLLEEMLVESDKYALIARIRGLPYFSSEIVLT